MRLAVFGFAGEDGPARRLAEQLGTAFAMVEVRSFPDGESLVRVPDAAETSLLYRPLDRPNGKLIEIILAASALRDRGAGKVMLVAPYLPYMRQDIAFRPGEAVSQRVIGALIAAHFDGLMTIDPHLHRIGQLGDVVKGIPAINVSAAPVLGAALAARKSPLLVGPDSESRPWVEAIAGPLRLHVLIGEKRRLGDRDVALTIPDVSRAMGRDIVLVDDVVSSGMTLMAAAKLLLDAGATRVEALATHGLATAADLKRMEDAGIARVCTTETVPGESARLPVAALLAEAIRAAGWT